MSRNYKYDYNWINDLAGAVDVLTKSMVLPESLTKELFSVSEKLDEIYAEACTWEMEALNNKILTIVGR